VKRLLALLFITVVLGILAIVLRQHQSETTSNIVWVLTALAFLGLVIQISFLLQPRDRSGRIREAPVPDRPTTLTGRVLPWGTPFPLHGGKSDPAAWDENENLPTS
jgi:hypothetical protein